MKRTKAQTENYYRELMDDLAESGLSLREFGATRGVPAGTLSSWRHQLKLRDAERAKKKAPETRFVPVNVLGAVSEPRGDSSGVYEIVLGRDRVLRLPADFDGARAAALVKAVMSC